MNVQARPSRANGLHDCRDAFAEALAALAESGPARRRRGQRLASARRKLMSSASAFPERLVNVGIAEQNLVGVGAGLANGGKHPLRVRRLLLPHRARPGADQGRRRLFAGQREAVRHQQRRRLRRAGPTHHSIEDVAWTARASPTSPSSSRRPVRHRRRRRAAAAHEGPVFLRISRMPVPVVHAPGFPFRLGRAERAARRRGPHHHRQRRHGRAGAGGRRAAAGARHLARAWSTCPASRRSTSRRSSTRRARPARSSPPRSTPSAAGWAAPWPRSSSPTDPVPMRILGFPGASRRPAPPSSCSSTSG